MRPSWLPKERLCHCGCGTEITRKGQRFAQKTHRIIWVRKLSTRGVLPVYAHRLCTECNGLMLLFPNTTNRSACDKPECRKKVGAKRLAKAIKTNAEKNRLRDAMTKQTPYLYGVKPIAIEMRQRAIELCDREGIRI